MHCYSNTKPRVLRRPVESTQYTSRDYQQRLADRRIQCSMSRRGNCWDNAVVESFFGTLKRELVDRQSWPTRGSLIRALSNYIDGWYNRERRHSALGYLSPMAYERRLQEAA